MLFILLLVYVLAIAAVFMITQFEEDDDEL